MTVFVLAKRPADVLTQKKSFAIPFCEPNQSVKFVVVCAKSNKHAIHVVYIWFVSM